MHWQDYEEWLHSKAETGQLFGTDWMAVEIAADAGVPVSRATCWLQAYERAQHRTRGAQTFYVQHRVPGTRTRSARWAYGVRAADTRAVHKQLADDAQARVRRVIRPTLLRIAKDNPRALPAAEGALQVIDGSLALLAGMLNNDGKDGEV